MPRRGIAAWLGAVVASSPLLCLAGAPVPAAPPEAVVERTERPRAGVTTLCLPNGVCVHLRPMPGRRVVIVATLAGGAVLEDPADVGLTLAAVASWRRGPDAEEAAEGGGPGAAGGQAVRVRADVSPEGVVLRLSAESARVSEALAALAGVVSQPKLDESRLAAWRSRLKALEARERSPERQVARALMDLLVPDGVPGDGQLPPVERLLGLERERVAAWLTERVASAPMEVAIAGPMDQKGVEALVARVLGPLPDRMRVDERTFAERRQARRAAGPINEEVALEIPAGTAHLMAGFTGPDVGMLADVRALNVGMSVARARLESLRSARPGEAEGPAAARLEAEMVGARVMPARQHPGLGAAIVMARVRDEGDTPEQAMLILHRVLHELVSSGPTPEEVATAAGRIAGDAAGDAQDPEYWAGVLSIATLQGMDIEALAEAAEVYERMTPEAVRGAMRRWCVVENRFSLVARGR